MKTNQILTSRELLGMTVYQRTKDSYFDASSLLEAGNKKREESGLSRTSIQKYTGLQSTQEFLDELRRQEGKEVWLKSKGGRGHKGVWVHPLAFIDFALWLHPGLKIETYRWIMDLLVRYRCDSGDNYKVMCGCLYSKMTNYSEFQGFIMDTCFRIKEVCGLKKNQDWNSASESQLRDRHKVQDNIIGLTTVLKDPKQAVDVGIAMFSGQQELENKNMENIN